MDKAFDVFFILGAPTHSGASLLGLVLGAQDSVLDLDEICYLDADYQSGRRCSCGKSARACAFWKQIFDGHMSIPMPDVCEASSGAKVHGRDAITNLKGYRRIKQFIVRDPTRLFPASQMQCEIQRTEALLRRAHEATGYSHFVDTSKSVWRISILQRSTIIRGKVIALVRDGRAIVSSQMDAAGERDALAKVGVRTIVRTFRWMLYMRTLHRFVSRTSCDCLVLSYEQMVMNPEKELGRICSFLGIKLDPETLSGSSPSFFARNRQHVLGPGGKQMELLLGISELRLVEEWRTRLTRWDRFLFRFVGGAAFNRKLRLMASTRNVSGE